MSGDEPSSERPTGAGAVSSTGDLQLWYSTAARRWEEALPIGNGRLGAMCFGGVASERVQLNDDTLWSGPPAGRVTRAPRALLPGVRQAVLDGRYRDAEAGLLRMQGPYTESYLCLGNLHLDFDYGRAPDDLRVSEFRRSLDLDTGVASVRYRIGEAVFNREAFVSTIDQAFIMRISCDRPGRLSLVARLNSPLEHEVVTHDGALGLTGTCPRHVVPSYRRSADPVVYEDHREGALHFAAVLVAAQDGGEVRPVRDGLEISAADVITLVLSTATGFDGYAATPTRSRADCVRVAKRRAEVVGARKYERLLTRHMDDHRRLFRRVELHLGSAPDPEVPTDERVHRVSQGGEDAALAALLFQYGRYLMISSSRPGTQPANLQGIWNESIRPPWSSNFTININTQMNYWPAEVTNLAECHEPLMDFVAELAVTGSTTADAYYGADGWVSHHNSDVWRHSEPVGEGDGDPAYANWPMGGAWLCQHLWEHYAFGGDDRFLRRAYPVLKSATEFCLNWLVEDGDGHLVTAPSTSPENHFITAEGARASVSVATTMDMAIIWDLLSNCIEAAGALGVDAGFVDRLATVRGRLLPAAVGSRGQLLEWSQEYREAEPEHRHLSHLFGLFPGRQVTPANTPDLAAAARRSLELRGDAATGWSLAWKICLWARLRDGERALELLCDLLTLVTTTDTTMSGGGLYPNLFCAHPPFQIDGNFGAVAGIAEMLVQSHTGDIDLLPALPPAWPNGFVRGLRARGGYEIDITWHGGRLTEARVLAHRPGPCRIRLGDLTATIAAEAGNRYRFGADLTMTSDASGLS